MNYSVIRNRVEQKGFTLKFFLERIGMTRQGFEPAIVNDTVSAKVLMKMSEVLGVPVSLFFCENETASGLRNGKSCQGCKDKQKIIQLLEDKIYLLEEKLDRYEDRTEKKAG